MASGGWQSRGRPEFFRSVEAHLGLGLHLAKGAESPGTSPSGISLPCTSCGLSRGPGAQWGSVVGHSWDLAALSVPVLCVASLFFFFLSTFSVLPSRRKLLFHYQTIVPFLEHSPGAGGAFSNVPNTLNCQRKKERRQGQKEDGG